MFESFGKILADGENEIKLLADQSKAKINFNSTVYLMRFYSFSDFCIFVVVWLFVSFSKMVMGSLAREAKSMQ